MNHFGKYPSITNNWLHFDIDRKSVIIDRHNINIPLLLQLNNNFEIKKILWEDKTNSIPLSDNIYKKNKFLYIDYCDKLDYWETGFCIKYIRDDWSFIIKKLKNDEKILIEND